MTASISTILLAAGTGDRLGGKNKAFLELEGMSYLDQALSIFSEFSGQIIVSVHSAELARLSEQQSTRKCQFVAGGETRQISFENAFEHVSGDIVLVQDVARPLTSVLLVRRVLDQAKNHGAVVPVVPIKSRDSLSFVKEGFIDRPAARENLVSLQTPQAYHRDLLAHVIAMAKSSGWADTSIVPLVRRAGFDVRTVAGDPDNIKVTYPEDQAFVSSKTEDKKS